MSASPDGAKRRTAGILGKVLNDEISLAEAAGRVADSPRLRFLRPVLEPIREHRRRGRWETWWRVERERPVSELARTVPPSLIEAVDSRWVRPPSAVMDVGCGRGQVSAWLADRGFDVLGVDFSEHATALARLHFGDDRERLEFRTLDMCRAVPEPGRFDWIVDRGCFHGIPEPLCAGYVANVAAWAKDDARLLLFCRIQRAHAVPALFGPWFEIVRTDDESYERSAGPTPRQVAPGKVFWMIRRRSLR